MYDRAVAVYPRSPGLGRTECLAKTSRATARPRRIRRSVARQETVTGDRRAILIWTGTSGLGVPQNTDGHDSRGAHVCRWGTGLFREHTSQMSHTCRSSSRLDSSKYDAQTQGHRFAEEIQVPDSGCPQLLRLRTN